MGRRAMLSITVSRLPHYTERGANGQWKICYFHSAWNALASRMDVLPPLLFIADRLTQNSTSLLTTINNALNIYLMNLIPYRSQNGGHYDEQQVLKPEFSSKWIALTSPPI